MDDLLISSRNFEEHLTHLEKVFKRCREVGLKLHLKKTIFCRTEVPFLGFLLSVEGIKPNPEKVAAIKEMPEPRSLEELRRVLGVMGYYGGFVPNTQIIRIRLGIFCQLKINLIGLQNMHKHFRP